MRNKTSVCNYARSGEYAKDWYAQAQEGIVDTFGYEHLHVVAEVLAITSPRVSVRKGMRITLEYLTTGSVDGCIRATRAAIAHWEDTREIRGPKTSAFAAALCGDDNVVVIDVWMARALGIEQKFVSSKRGYTQASEVVRRAADALGWTPCQTQAAAWTGVREEYGMRDKRLAYNLMLDECELYRDIWIERIMLGIKDLAQYRWSWGLDQPSKLNT